MAGNASRRGHLAANLPTGLSVQEATPYEQSEMAEDGRIRHRCAVLPRAESEPSSCPAGVERLTAVGGVHINPRRGTSASAACLPPATPAPRLTIAHVSSPCRSSPRIAAGRPGGRSTLYVRTLAGAMPGRLGVGRGPHRPRRSDRGHRAPRPGAAAPARSASTSSRAASAASPARWRPPSPGSACR